MYKYLIMLTFCLVTQRTYCKSLFQYNINPEYDLIAEKSNSYSNIWPSSEFIISPHLRYKHHARGIGHGRGHGKRNHGISPYAFGHSHGYDYDDSSEDYSEIYHSPHYYPHRHGLPPGHAKKHNHHHNHPHEIPPRFPPPPVYHKDFINPWTLSETTPKLFIAQQPQSTTPRSFTVQQPHLTRESTTSKIMTITTAAPTSSTTADDQLIYDIDVRFGRE